MRELAADAAAPPLPPAQAARAAWLCAAPAGARRFLVERDGAPAALLVAPARWVWIDGREVRFRELADPLAVETGFDAEADPELARALGAVAGLALGQDLVHYAFPTESSWSAGRRFAGFDVVRTQPLLVLADPPACEAPPEVEELRLFDHQVRWLWDRCASAFGACGRRDEELLRWRFGPGAPRPVALLGVRDAQGILRGLAGYARGPWLARRGAQLVEWLVPPEEPEVGELLLRAVRARAAAEGAQSVTGLVVEWSPWFARLQEAGWRVHPSPLLFVARSAARRFDHLWLRDHWWLTLADTELV